MKKSNSSIFINFLSNRSKNIFIKKIINSKIFSYLIFLILDENKLYDQNLNFNKSYLDKKIIYKIYYYIRYKKFGELFKETQPKYIGIFTLNLLGLQIFRILYFELVSLIKKKLNKKRFFESEFFSKKDIGILENEGVLKKKDIISEDERLRLVETFKNNKSKYAIINDKNHKTNKLILNELNNADINFIDDIELKLRKLACHQLGIELINKKSEISIFEDYYVDYKYGISDQQDIPHTDVPFKTFKGFIYLIDVDNSNGAFTYYKKTHKKFKFTRIFGEYLASLTYKNGTENLKKNYAFKFFSKFKSSNFEEKRRTLIFADTSGYHCRGPFFENNKKRLILYFNFRYLNQF